MLSPTRGRIITFSGLGDISPSRRKHSLLEAAGVEAATISELHDAAKKGDVQQLAQCLAVPGANLEVTDCTGSTPLHYAAREGQENTASMLIQAGASLAARDADGCMPLHGAASTGHVGTMRLLLHARSDVCALDHKGNTVLHLAAERAWGSDEAGRLLLDARAEVNLKNATGYTPLACADDLGSRVFTDLLRESGGIR